MVDRTSPWIVSRYPVHNEPNAWLGEPFVIETQQVQEGLIIATGPGDPVPDASSYDEEPWKADEKTPRFRPMQARVGDHAIFFRKAAVEITFEEKKYLKQREEHYRALLKRLLAHSRLTDGPAEGLYVRREEDGRLMARAKLVRAEFVQAIEQHWSKRQLEPNRLIPSRGTRS